MNGSVGLFQSKSKKQEKNMLKELEQNLKKECVGHVAG